MLTQLQQDTKGNIMDIFLLYPSCVFCSMTSLLLVKNDSTFSIGSSLAKDSTYQEDDLIVFVILQHWLHQYYHEIWADECGVLPDLL